MPIRRKNKSMSSLHRKPKALSKKQKRLKDLEDGFNTWNPERLQEYDPFQDGNMRTYFTTKTVRKVLLDKGIIKAQNSPDGKVQRYVVNDEMPKNIFFTKKSPEEIAASKTRLPAIRRTETPVLSLADSEMVQKTFEMLTDAMHKKMSKPIEIFREIDIDESGQVTYKELREGLLKTLDLKFTDEQFSALISTVDRDGSGDVDYRELTKQMKKHDLRRKEELLKKQTDSASSKYENAEKGGKQTIPNTATSKNAKASVKERMKQLDIAAKNPMVAQNFYEEGQAFLRTQELKKTKQVKINLKASSGKAKKKTAF